MLSFHILNYVWKNTDWCRCIGVWVKHCHCSLNKKINTCIVKTLGGTFTLFLATGGTAVGTLRFRRIPVRNRRTLQKWRNRSAPEEWRRNWRLTGSWCATDTRSRRERVPTRSWSAHSCTSPHLVVSQASPGPPASPHTCSTPSIHTKTPPP